MAIQSPDLLPSPVSLLAISPLALSTSAAQKKLAGSKMYYSPRMPSFCTGCCFFLEKPYLPSPPLPTSPKGGVPQRSLNLLGHGTYHLYYNYLIICLFSVLDFKIL